MAGIQKKIRSYIEQNKDDYIRFLQEFVRYDSVIGDNGIEGNEGPAQKWLAEQLARYGAEVRSFEPDNEKIREWPSFNPDHDYENRPNVVGLWRGSDPKNFRSIILNGHVDVVPTGDRSDWSVDPFGAEIKNDAIYGRGTVDMKGGLSCGILAVSLLKELGVELKGDVFVESVVDEEGGGNGTLAVRAEGYSADAAIILEASNMEVHRANLGASQFQIEVPGRATHAGLKPQGVSAIDKAYKVLNALNELEHKWLLSKHHSLFSTQFFVFGMVKAGFSPAAVPGSCIIRGVLQYLPVYMENGQEVFQTIGDVEKEIRETIDNVCQGDPFLRNNPVQFTWTQDSPPYHTPESAEVVKVSAEVCQRVLGKSTVTGMLMGSDGRSFQYADIPVVILGPGDPARAHTIDEYLKISEYLAGIEVIANLLVEWTSLRKEQSTL